MVSVKTLAEAHLKAITVPEAANERFLILNGTYSVKQIADSLSAEFAS